MLDTIETRWKIFGTFDSSFFAIGAPEFGVFMSASFCGFFLSLLHFQCVSQQREIKLLRRTAAWEPWPILWCRCSSQLRSNATSRVPRFDVDATILQRRHFRLKKWWMTIFMIYELILLFRGQKADTWRAYRSVAAYAICKTAKG